MKKDGKYRYSLQFGSDSEKEIRAGEFLERLGNKKSSIIVAALNDYLIAHPELETTHCKIKVTVDSGYDRQFIEKIIRTVVEEKLREVSEKNLPEVFCEQKTSDMLEEDVAQMLDNLDVFQ